MFLNQITTHESRKSTKIFLLQNIFQGFHYTKVILANNCFVFYLLYFISLFYRSNASLRCAANCSAAPNAEHRLFLFLQFDCNRLKIIFILFSLLTLTIEIWQRICVYARVFQFPVDNVCQIDTKQFCFFNGIISCTHIVLQCEKSISLEEDWKMNCQCLPSMTRGAIYPTSVEMHLNWMSMSKFVYSCFVFIFSLLLFYGSSDRSKTRAFGLIA